VWLLQDSSHSNKREENYRKDGEGRTVHTLAAKDNDDDDDDDDDDDAFYGTLSFIAVFPRAFELRGPV
jgi:hypothetical protein